MTHEEFQNQKRAIPNLELAEKACSAVIKLCETGGKSFTMSVPVRLDDTDVILSEVIRRFLLLHSESVQKETTEDKPIPRLSSKDWFEQVLLKGKSMEYGTNSFSDIALLEVLGEYDKYLTGIPAQEVLGHASDEVNPVITAK